MADKIRIGLIGTGRIGQVHAESIAASNQFDLTYIADTYIAGAERISAQYGGEVTDDPETLLTSDKVDAVLIASPTPTHVNLIRRGIELGLHVLCEKPIDLDIQRVDELRHAAANAKTKIALGFNRRFDPNFSAVKRRVAAGEIGALEQLIIISRDPAPAPRDYIAVSGGIFRDMTIHDFDMARFLLGEEITEVVATAAVLVDKAIGEAGDFDSVQVMLKTATGKQAMISNSRRATYGYDQRIEVHGSKGMVKTSMQSTWIDQFGHA